LNFRRALRWSALYAFHVGVVRPILRWVVGIRYRRRSLVPDGPCIVVANHNSHLDAPVLLSLFPLRRLRHVHPVAAADYFDETWLRRTMSMVLMNAVPIRRQPGHGQDPLAHVVAALRSGETIILFPEGTRGEAGVVAPFRAGVGRIVKTLPGVAVVPVFLSGPERIWPRGETVPVPLGIDVHVGKPRTYDATREPREIADAIRNDVLALAPAPAASPAPRPVRGTVAVWGGRAEERRAVTREVARVLAEDAEEGALLLADDVLEVNDDAASEPTARLPRRRGWHALLARITGTRPPLDGVRFAELVRRGRAEQDLARDPLGRPAATEGCALMELLVAAPEMLATDREAHQRVVYAEALRRIPLRNWPAARRSDPEVWLLNAWSLARLAAPAVLVCLAPGETDRRAAAVLRRARKTLVLEAPAGTSPAAFADAVRTACRRPRAPAGDDGAAG
jgi:1-acyl-sn-glycerol-3-phosphate acyltransferase